jgi:hypothetical protein
VDICTHTLIKIRYINSFMGVVHIRGGAVPEPQEPEPEPEPEILRCWNRNRNRNRGRNRNHGTARNRPKSVQFWPKSERIGRGPNGSAEFGILLAYQIADFRPVPGNSENFRPNTDFPVPRFLGLSTGTGTGTAVRLENRNRSTSGTHPRIN